MTTFSQRNQAAMRAIMADAVRTIHWRHIEYLYGETPIGVVAWAAQGEKSRTLVTLDLTSESWATGVFVAAIAQHVACYHGSTEINSRCAFTVRSVDVAHHRLVLGGNADDVIDIANLFRQPREHPVTLHPIGARR